MPDDQEQARRDGRIPDALWERIEPLLPARQPHPLGCHRPRVDARQAMDAILFVLRTGCQWNALNETKSCSSSFAHRRCQEWVEADVFVALWAQGRVAYDALQGMDWEWLAMEGAMTKAPLGGEKVGKNPTDRGQLGTTRRVLTDGRGVPLGLAVDGANRHDVKLTRETIESSAVERPDAPQTPPRGGVSTKAMIMTRCGRCSTHLVSPPLSWPGGKEAQALKQEGGVKARRWVVERTQSWMNRFRRVLIRWDKKVRNDLGFLHLACAYSTYRQAGLLG